MPAAPDGRTMGLLRSTFGPSKREIWSQIAREIGAEYREGGGLRE